MRKHQNSVFLGEMKVMWCCCCSPSSYRAAMASPGGMCFCLHIIYQTYLRNDGRSAVETSLTLFSPEMMICSVWWGESGGRWGYKLFQSGGACSRLQTSIIKFRCFDFEPPFPQEVSFFQKSKRWMFEKFQTFQYRMVRNINHTFQYWFKPRRTVKYVPLHNS